MSQAEQTLPSEQQIEVGDHVVAWRWMKEKARNDPDGFLRLAGPNVRRLEKILGKAQWRSSGERGWTHAWAVARHGLNWMILSGPESTIYRLRVPSDGEDYLQDRRVGIGAVAMLSELLDALSSTPKCLASQE